MIFNRGKVNRMEKRIEDLEESLEGLKKDIKYFKEDIDILCEKQFKLERIIQRSEFDDITYYIKLGNGLNGYFNDTYFYKDGEEYYIKGLSLGTSAVISIQSEDVIKVFDYADGVTNTYVVDLKKGTFIKM